VVTRQIPWPGPKPYTDELSTLFMGRDREISKILDMLQGESLSLMTASSGAGKTSLIQAGLIPNVREMRISELVEDPDEQPLAPFPLLLNQWLGRAGKAGRLDYAQLIALEMHRYLGQSLAWYEAELEQGAAGTRKEAIEREARSIQAACDGIAEYAVSHGFGERVDSDGGVSLVWTDPGDTVDPDDQREITTRLLDVVDQACGPLGDILIILDQFEEILLDWRLGEQAVAAVESVLVLRPKTARQFISMRHDGLHLIDGLEAKGLLESRRRVKIEPLSVAMTKDVIGGVSEAEGHTWDTACDVGGTTVLDALVRSFASTPGGSGTRAGEVNLIGLQVVLNGIFRSHLAPGEMVTAATLEEYCRTLARPGISVGSSLAWWLDEGHLRVEAPRQWVLECLRGSSDFSGEQAPSPDVYEPQVQPMAARMSWLLVTPSGNKRTMTATELHEDAYGEEIRDIDEDDLAGLAREECWTLDRLAEVLGGTCGEALARLTRGNVLKMRGAGVLTDTAYELVHDQFGKPLQEWARDFESTPEFDLSSIRAIQSRPFKWSGALAPHDDDGIIPFAVWRDCTLKKVDLSDLTFKDCDFSDTLFSNCTFKKVVFERCVFSGVTFKGTSVFRDVVLQDCDLGGAIFETGTELHSVKVTGGEGLAFSLVRGTLIADCSFSMPEGLSDEHGEPLLLDMRYARFIDCRFKGTNLLTRCDLDGAAISGQKKPSQVLGSLVFSDSEMQSIELANIDVSGQSLVFNDCNCRGALFDRIDAGQDDDGRPADVDFNRVILIGATAVGCTFEDVTISGPADVSTFVISDKPRTARTKHVPSTIARLRFENLDAENISIERCTIIDDITFSNCMLSGATFVGDAKTRRLRGDMIFIDDCDLSAAEFRNLHFTADHQLRIKGCRAQGAFFREVAIVGEGADRPAGLFDQTNMAGALIWGCTLSFCRFTGTSEARASMPTLVMRPIIDESSKEIGVPTRVSNLVFMDVDMPGFLMQDVEVTDDLEFLRCDVGYGSVGQSSGRSDNRLRVRGDLIFDDCDMTAIEFSALQFTDESVRIRNSICNSAMFYDVRFDRRSEREVGLLIDNSDLTGALFWDCEITRAQFRGKSDTSPTPAISMTFRKTEGDRAVLGDVVIENYVLDGGAFEGLSLVGPVRVTNCSALRTKYTDLVAENGGFLDLRESDVLYAQVDDDLLANGDTVRFTAAQKEAAGCQKAYEGQLRFQERRVNGEG